MKTINIILFVILICVFVFTFCISLKSNNTLKEVDSVMQEENSVISQYGIIDVNNWESETLNNEFFYADKGYLNISNEDFIKKVNQVTANTTYDELIKIFGESPYVVLETGVNLLTYYNDEYSFILSPGVDVFFMKHNINIRKQSDNQGMVSVKTEPEKN